jgi:hypothetical protein
MEVPEHLKDEVAEYVKAYEHLSEEDIRIAHALQIIVVRRLEGRPVKSKVQ